MDLSLNLNSLQTMIIGILGPIFVFLLYFLYLRNLSSLLKAVRAPNRKMQPGQVWPLLLNVLVYILSSARIYFYYAIPQAAAIVLITQYLCLIFVIIWQFRVVYKIADSIEAEYDSREIPIERRPTFQTGIFMSVARVFSVLSVMPGLVLFGGLGGFAYLIGFIAYWMRTHKFKKELQALPDYNDDEESLIFKDLPPG